MEAHTLQILLAEHARLRELEKARTETYNNVVQRFMTISTTAVGATLLLIEKKMFGGQVRETAQIVLTVLLFFGSISFLGLLGLDFALLSLSLRYQMIRNKFLEADPTLKDVFPTGILLENIQNVQYDRWSSLKGVVQRALMISGPKTTVALLNCTLAGGIGYVLSWPLVDWARIVIGLISAILFGLVQSLFASWRYRAVRRYTLPGKVHWWI